MPLFDDREGIVNAEQLQALVQELHDRMMRTRRCQAIAEAHAAPGGLGQGRAD